MDLYSDLPPTKDGSAATVGKEQIHLLKQPALPPTAPPSVATQPSTSPRAPQTCAESSNEPGKTPPLSDKDKPLFMVSYSCLRFCGRNMTGDLCDLLLLRVVETAAAEQSVAAFCASTEAKGKFEAKAEAEASVACCSWCR